MEDYLILTGGTKKEVLKKTRASKKKVVYRPVTEEMLRFVIEKVPVDIVLGAELINPKDSVHFVRGGLDQITCKIAAKNAKTIGFSFEDILNTKNRPQLMARMSFNLKLCKKYKVKTLFASFSENSYSANDLAAFSRVLQKQRNIYK